MLFIYVALPVGGIETFFVRMAKCRYERGLVTKILLTGPKFLSDSQLLSEASKYAEIYYVEDVYMLPEALSRKFLLVSPLKKNKVQELFEQVTHVHVANGLGAMIGNRLIQSVNIDVKLTIGFYHFLEYSWGENLNLPYFERTHRDFIFNKLPKQNLFLFSHSTMTFNQKRLGVDLSCSPTFRIGVINRPENERANVHIFSKSRNSIKICSVGRLVDFKTYNFWMLDVVFNLREQGCDVIYDIYGEGDMLDKIQRRITELGLEDQVKLQGTLAYNDFDKVVIGYDLFVGSGTAIIQSSALGVPSLIGIESVSEPFTYGFFKDFSHSDYNISTLPFEKVSSEILILNFMKLSDDAKAQLSQEHIDSVEEFYMDICNSNFEKHGVSIRKSYSYSAFLYELSWKLASLHHRFFKNSIYRSRYLEKGLT